MNEIKRKYAQETQTKHQRINIREKRTEKVPTQKLQMYKVLKDKKSEF